MLQRLFEFLIFNILSPLVQQDFKRFKSARRICFIHFGGMGDYITFAPLIRLFRDTYPEAHITLMTQSNFKPVQALLPEIDEVIVLPLHKRKLWHLLPLLRKGRYDVLLSGYDFVIPYRHLTLALGMSGIPIRIGSAETIYRETILTHALPNMVHNPDQYIMDTFGMLAEAFFKLIGQPQPQQTLLSYFHHSVDTQVQDELVTLLAKYPAVPQQPKVVIHPGTSRESKVENWKKSWPVGSWHDLIAKITTHYPNATVYLTGGPDDAEEVAAIEQSLHDLPETNRHQVINVFGQVVTVGCLAALFSMGDAAVCCDSFAMHLALFSGTPLVAIFALTNEKRFLPVNHPEFQGHYQVAVRDDLSCRPCLHLTRTQSCEDPVCQQVAVEQVFQKLQQVLSV